MYHGAQEVQEVHYADVYMPAMGRSVARPKGVVWVLRHQYACDVCGRQYGFTEQAEEPFYCMTCQALVSIAPTSAPARKECL